MICNGNKLFKSFNGIYLNKKEPSPNIHFPKIDYSKLLTILGFFNLKEGHTLFFVEYKQHIMYDGGRNLWAKKSLNQYLQPYYF